MKGGGTIIGPGNKCVDVAADDTGTNGSAVQLWDCQSYAIDQHWFHNANGSLETLGRCLDIVGNGTAKRREAQAVGLQRRGRPGLAAAIQRITAQPAVRSLSRLAPSGSTANGVQLQIYDCNGTADAIALT